MRNKHGDFIWYELMTRDADAAQDFYGGLIGWSFAPAGDGEEDMGDYRLFSADGPAVGGLMPLTPEMIDGGARPLWAGYIGVEDVDATVRTIGEAGGNVMMGPMDIPKVGRFAFVADPQGAPFYIMRGEPDQQSESFAAHEPRVGHCAWNELWTADPEAAKHWYGRIFGFIKDGGMPMGDMGEYEFLRNAGQDFMFGAVMKKPAEMPVSLWAYYFRVPDIDIAADYIGANGGQVMNGPMEIPGGDFALQAMDPQGAMFGLVGPRK